jgi:Bacterial TSP3 repeat
MPHHPRIVRTVALSAVALVAILAAAGMAAAEATVAKRPALRAPQAAGHADRHRRKAHRRSRRRDSDHDGLSNWTEVHRTKTNPHKADTDGDGLSDWMEVRVTKTNPREADSDGDGFSDGDEIVAGTGPWDPLSFPGVPAPAGSPAPPPPPPLTSPEPESAPQEEPATETARAIWTAPSDAKAGVPVALDGTASTGAAPLACTWSFENQSGSIVWQTKSGCDIDFTFESTGTKYVKLVVDGAKGGSDSNKQSFDVGQGPGTEPPPEEETEEESPSDTTPPDTTILSGPSGTTTSTSASFSFSSTESGSTFECKLDSGAYASCFSPKTYSGLSVGSHTFSVRATDAAGNTDPSPASRSWTVEEESEPPPSGEGCTAGATNATSASAAKSAVSAGNSVCVTAAVGDVNFNSMGDRSGVVVSTEGGSMGEIDISATTGLTIRNARFRSVELRGAHRTTIEGSTIGGTKSNRVEDQLIFMPDESNDVVIRDNDIGWTKADNSGNTGYGCRCYGATNNLRFVGNRVHDIAADGFQGTNGSNVLIDRNEIGPVGANPGSSEHSDNIQIVSNGPNLRITNNWIHEQGYYEGNITGNSGSTYIHGGTSNSVLYENNLVETNQGRTEVCGLGTGGTSRSNITIRRNTWVEGGLAYNSFPGFEWDCDSGSGNTVDHNIAVDPDGGFAQDGASSAATFASNLWGKPSLVTLDASGNCTSANCNPAGQEPIGYRKPSGVAW